jgi:hypothetical protein
MPRLLILIVPVLLAGCSNSPPPIAIAPEITPKAPEFQAPPKPAASTAEAKALLADTLAAHTAGQPDKMKSLQSIVFERRGRGRTPDGGYGPLSWQGKLAGARQYRVLFRFLDDTGHRGVQIFDGTKAAMGPPEGPFQLVPAAFLRDITLQIGEESVLYLFGLADPALTAQTAAVPKWDDREMLGLHVWSPTIEHMLLHVDAKTKRIARLQYMGSEAGSKLSKEVLVLGHREIGGLQLPEKYSVSVNGNTILDWDSLMFEAGATLEPKLFEVP